MYLKMSSLSSIGSMIADENITLYCGLNQVNSDQWVKRVKEFYLIKLGCFNAKFHTFYHFLCQMEHQVDGLGALVLN